MERTKSSAREIADQTGINVTLLSKLKNGQRKLQYSSRYPTLLADFFLQSRAERSAHVVQDLLVRRDGLLDGAAPAQLREALALWLCSEAEEETRAPHSAPSVQVIRSVSELAPLLDAFTEQVLAAPVGKVSVVHDFPDLGQSASFPDFSLPWLERIRRRGYSIQILDNGNAPKTYMSIFNWMEFYFSDQVQFLSMPEHPHTYRTLFFMEGVCALLILADQVGQKLFLCTLYSGSEGTEYFLNSLNVVVGNSSRGIEKIPFRSIPDFLQTLDRFLTPQPTTYLINPVMMYKTMGIELLDRVLMENGISKEQREAFKTNRFTAYLRTKCPYKQIYDLSAMTRAATMESTVDEELSALYGRPITVSRKQLHEHLLQLIGLHQAERYQILFVPFETLRLMHGTISYVIQRDSLFLAWDASRSDSRIYSRDPAIVNASYNYMEEIWNSIPAEYTTPEWQREQLNKLLELTAD